MKPETIARIRRFSTERDWEQILCRHPKRILYAHANEQKL